MDIKKILSILPHRYPFLMIDKIMKTKNKNELIAIKNVSINEPYFQGHFPTDPIMPGVLQIEAMAQAAGVLMLQEEDYKHKIIFFMSCDKVKFRRIVQPGDQINIHAKIIKRKIMKKGILGIAQCICKVDMNIVSSADLMFNIIDKNNN